MNPPRQKQAFTLIELLIVVAIIAILAAIATPNFLEAMTRARISRVKSDLRTLNTAMEAYAVDNNDYPWCNPEESHSFLHDIPSLTTPVAYMQNFPEDVFPNPDATPVERSYRYYPVQYWKHAYPKLRQWRWVVMSNGPDCDIDITRENAQNFIDGKYHMLYNPTNGTRSNGEIVLTNLGFLPNTL